MNYEKEVARISGRITGLENILAGRAERKSIGEQITESITFQGFQAGNSDLARIETKASVVSTGGLNDRLVPSFTPPVAPTAQRQLALLDVIPKYPTVSGAIELPVATVTNSASGQVAGSPELREDVTVPESAVSFASVFQPVQTYSHHIPVSTQVWEDSNVLRAFLETEMVYGLRASIENGVLNGAGTTGVLDGLLNNAAAYSLRSPNLTAESDIIRDAIRQVNAANFRATHVVLNPSDFYDLDVTLDDAGANRIIAGPQLWGLPVIESTAISSGTFLVIDSQRAALMFERTPLEVEFARNDASNFQANKITVKAQQRLALVTCNAAAMVTGSL